MPEYTVLAVVSVLVMVAAELLWFRTGIFGRLQFWLSMAIVYFFHVLVDGWLTKLSDPIVIYDPDHLSGVRFPWDIPVEDYLFGFSMITLTMVLWIRAGEREAHSPEATADTVTAGARPVPDTEENA